MSGTSFPNTIYSYQPPGIEGDFCSVNPTASVIAGEGAYIAGQNGLNIARFGWADANRQTVSNTGAGLPTGFVPRRMGESNLNQFPLTYTTTIQSGRPVTLHDSGDFWVRSSTAMVVGQKIFAKLSDGSIACGATGTTMTGFVETQWYSATNTAVGDVGKMTTRVQA